MMSNLWLRARKMFSYSSLMGDTQVTHSSTAGMTMSEPLRVVNNKRRRQWLMGLIAILLITLLILALVIKRQPKMATIVSSRVVDQHHQLHLDSEESKEELDEDNEADDEELHLHADVAEVGPQESSEPDFEEEERVTLEELVKFELAADNQYALNASWSDDETLVYRQLGHGLVALDVQSGKRQLIMSEHKMSYFHVSDFWLSADKSYVMLKTWPRRVFRHSSLSIYKLLPLKNGHTDVTLMELRPTTSTSKKSSSRRGSQRIRYARFAPTGNALVFVDSNNDVYYRSAVLEADERLTRDGHVSNIFNGVPDWVFEEEVMETDNALYWSPDGQKLVWGHFDDTEVKEVFLKSYGSLNPSRLEQYPEFSAIKYPKTDSENPKVGLFVADASGGREGEITIRQLSKPNELINRREGRKDEYDDIFFSKVVWVDSKRFLVQWLNRVQNDSVISLCEIGALDDCKSVFQHQQKDGWVETKLQILVQPRAKDNEEFHFVIVLGDPRTPERYRQLLLVSSSSSELSDKGTWLTSSSSDVSKLKLWSATSGHIYYTAALEERPGTQHLFRVRVDISNSSSSNPECVSCDLHKLVKSEQKCGYVNVELSPEATKAALTCSGPDVPYTLLVSLESEQLRLLSVFDDNADLASFLELKALPEVRVLSIPLSSNKQKARVKLYTPPNLKSGEKYALLVNAYGGPNSQYVDEQFNQHEYQTYLSSSYNFVYAVIDPVGTSGQGDAFRFATFHRFGGPEVDSVLEVVHYLKSNLEFVDAKRTAIWGWSYGGFLSVMALAKGGDVFACGAAVAPVVDWSLYDTIYTERYMGRRSDNPQGYNDSEAYWYLEGLRDKPFYLLHGTKDDNVHFQQSMLLSAALEKRDILFRQQAYPDQRHSIFDYLRHLYHSLTDFFVNDCFQHRTQINEPFYSDSNYQL